MLIQKEKVHIDCEKSAQVSILTSKTQYNNDPVLLLRSPNKLYITFFFFFLLCSHYVADSTKKVELRLMVVSG